MAWRQDIIDFFTNEGRVIRDAPGSFALAVITAGLLLWGALSWKFDAQLSSKDAVLTSKDEQLKSKNEIIAARDATIKFHDALLAEYRNKLQIPTEIGQIRTLAPEQRRVLVQELKKNIDKFPKIIIYANRDSEPRDYAKQFADLFYGIGIEIIKRDAPANATELGLFVGIRAMEPSENAKLFMAILSKANIEAHYTPWSSLGEPEYKDIDYDLYVARPFW